MCYQCLWLWCYMKLCKTCVIKDAVYGSILTDNLQAKIIDSYVQYPNFPGPTPCFLNIVYIFEHIDVYPFLYPSIIWYNCHTHLWFYLYITMCLLEFGIRCKSVNG